ncbi:MAG TPA: hypothetical protein VLL54_09600 [Pyrinomonadaceae bacterium]|nr:hypothetical protein [Pyrinomonadaceae bacterium]
MKQLMRLVINLSWWLGILSVVAAVVIKLLQYEQRVHVTGHTLFLVATTFFLCVIATREMERMSAGQ